MKQQQPIKLGAFDEGLFQQWEKTRSFSQRAFYFTKGGNLYGKKSISN